MNVLGLVPMKGHSERVPGKNMRDIAGRPLFSWILDALSQASQVNEVMVDTDSDEIEAAVRADFPDVTIHRRPERLFGDTVPMHDIVASVADSATHEILLQTHSTNPLLRASTIDTAIREFKSRQGVCDSLMSVTELRSRFFFEDGRPINHDPARLLRTQDLQPVLEENSNLYVAPVHEIRESRLRIGRRPILFPIDPKEAVDIDDEFDFQLAEWLLEHRDE